MFLLNLAPQGTHPRPIGRCPGLLRTASPQDPETLCGRQRRQALNGAGLSLTGISNQQDELTLARAGTVQG